MLYKWQTEPDIQEAERGLYALPWASNPDLLRQTLNLTFAGKRLLSCLLTTHAKMPWQLR